MKISCAWWNTSLAPTKASDRATDESKRIALQVISELLVTRGFHILGLCELSEAEIDWLKDHCSRLGFEVVSGVEKLNRVTYDTCLIYDSKTLQYRANKNIHAMSGQSTQKIAQRVEFTILKDQTLLNVFVSHWPSVMRMNKSNVERNRYGDHLKSAVDEVWEVDPLAKIILMGDYNDEPFDTPLAFNLKATRDRHLASAKPGSLYNPFWNRIGSDRDYSRGSDNVGFCGTYFYAKDKLDRWRTFDQIIVSSGLLGQSQWHLDESAVEVINLPSYTEQVMDKKTKFDHFPVAITIEWKAL
ncbi:endonuclease/exonuclease/phosphatase family protein [Glaciimonas sp. GNP009]